MHVVLESPGAESLMPASSITDGPEVDLARRFNWVRTELRNAERAPSVSDEPVLKQRVRQG